MKGSELRRIRKRLGLTQQQMARWIGCNWNSVARWERDEMGMKPTTEKLIRVLAKQSKPKK